MLLRLQRSIAAAALVICALPLLHRTVRAENWPGRAAPREPAFPPIRIIRLSGAKRKTCAARALPDRGNSTPVVWGERHS